MSHDRHRYPYRYPPELKIEILKLWDDGVHSTRKITRALEAKYKMITAGGVEGILLRQGRKSKYSKALEDRIRSMKLTGMTNGDIALTLGTRSSMICEVGAQIKISDELLYPVQDDVAKVVDMRRSISRLWKPGRYLIMADNHIKFHHMGVIQEILSLKGDFDGCVIAGDFIDEYWISRFRKEQVVGYTEELKVAMEVMKWLIHKFHRVLYIHGNHEDRRYKTLLQYAEPIARLLKEASLGELSAKKAIAALPTADVEFYHIIDKIRSWGYYQIGNLTVHPNWFIDICNGKIIISHPDRFMNVPGNAAKAVVEHMFNYHDAYKLERFDALLMGHPHRLDGPKNRLGVYTWELPGMCPPLPYQVGPKASNAGKIDIGYSIVTTRPNGTLRFNESRSFLVDGW